MNGGPYSAAEGGVNYHAHPEFHTDPLWPGTGIAMFSRVMWVWVRWSQQAIWQTSIRVKVGCRCWEVWVRGNGKRARGHYWGECMFNSIYLNFDNSLLPSRIVHKPQLRWQWWAFRWCLCLFNLILARLTCTHHLCLTLLRSFTLLGQRGLLWLKMTMRGCMFLRRQVRGLSRGHQRDEISCEYYLYLLLPFDLFL